MHQQHRPTRLNTKFRPQHRDSRRPSRLATHGEPPQHINSALHQRSTNTTERRPAPTPHDKATTKRHSDNATQRHHGGTAPIHAQQGNYKGPRPPPRPRALPTKTPFFAPFYALWGVFSCLYKGSTAGQRVEARLCRKMRFRKSQIRITTPLTKKWGLRNQSQSITTRVLYTKRIPLSIKHQPTYKPPTKLRHLKRLLTLRTPRKLRHTTSSKLQHLQPSNQAMHRPSKPTSNHRRQTRRHPLPQTVKRGQLLIQLKPQDPRLQSKLLRVSTINIPRGIQLLLLRQRTTNPPSQKTSYNLQTRQRQETRHHLRTKTTLRNQEITHRIKNQRKTSTTRLPPYIPHKRSNGLIYRAKGHTNRQQDTQQAFNPQQLSNQTRTRRTITSTHSNLYPTRTQQAKRAHVRQLPRKSPTRLSQPLQEYSNLLQRRKFKPRAQGVRRPPQRSLQHRLRNRHPQAQINQRPSSTQGPNHHQKMRLSNRRTFKA